MAPLDELLETIQSLDACVWRKGMSTQLINEWLRCFGTDCAPDTPGRLHALYMLSRFMYFGDAEVRALLLALHRDLFTYPLVAAARKRLNDTRDRAAIAREYDADLQRSRFLAIGNPSESGAHLLYHYRQENDLASTLFITTHEIFNLVTEPHTLALPEVARYVFIDDFCGSGKTGCRASRDLLPRIRAAASTSGVVVRIAYHVMVGTERGLSKVRTEADFDEVMCVLELDESFRVFTEKSRYFRKPPTGVAVDRARALAETHGRSLSPSDPLGFDDGQLLLGFVHNTPNNTLPVFWHRGTDRSPWFPLFRRYYKLAAPTSTPW